MTSLAKVSAISTPAHELQADLLVLPIHSLEDLASTEITPILEGLNLDQLAHEEGFKAKAGQTLLLRGLPTAQTPRILILGLGDDDDVRSSLVTAARSARKLKSKHIAILNPKKELTRKVVEGFLFGAYSFDKYKTTDEKDEHPYKGIEEVSLLGEHCPTGLDKALAYTRGVYIARDLGNEPPNSIYPETLADEAVKIAKEYGLKHTVYDEKYLTKHGFNLLMAVGKGCEHQPRLIHLEYKPKGEVKRTIALVGKGVTFDTGGYNLKPSGSILNMHLDMCGGAAVLGAAKIIGQLKPENVAVHFIVPSVVNSVSSTSYLPNDIIKGLGGKTVEIQNTDAEGRLILADALTYAQQQNPDEIIDLATLTGACVVALGELTAALYSSDETMAEGILQAAKSDDEDMWRMPLTKKLDSSLDSKVADMRNIGSRMGGSITAALFLKRWVDIDSWAHIDLAGPAMADSDTSLSSAGGTGYGTALLASYILSKA